MKNNELAENGGNIKVFRNKVMSSASDISDHERKLLQELETNREKLLADQKNLQTEQEKFQAEQKELQDKKEILQNKQKKF